MASTESHTIRLTLRSIISNDDILLQPSKMQNYIGVWLDENCDQKASALVNETLHDIFESFEIFVNWPKCIAYINEPRPAKIFFIVSPELGQNLIPLMLHQDTSSIAYIYIYYINEKQQDDLNFKQSDKFRGRFTTIEGLTEQIKSDISVFDQRIGVQAPTTISLTSPPAITFNNASAATVSDNQSIDGRTVYAIPSTSFFNEEIKSTPLKDLSKDSVWFIQFQLLVEILIRLGKSEQAKHDILFICRKYYKNDTCEKCKIDQFEKEANNISKAIYWYTAGSFIVHLLNRVCDTEDVDHLYYFRLFISNLHRGILEMEHDALTINLRTQRTVLYRGKRMAASTLENFRKNINSLVAMKGFLSTTTDVEVAKVFAGGGIEQTGSVCVLFTLNVDNWGQCKPSAALKPDDCAIKDEEEVLFSIGSIWRIDSVKETGEHGVWCIQLTSCQEENARSIELTKYLKEQLGETNDLWTLGDFLMKMGEYDKAERYYKILENDLKLPKRHAHRATIYNRLGLIRREQGQLHLATEYFEKAVKAAPQNNKIKGTAEYNKQVAQEDSKRIPVIFLRKRLGSSDVISKSLATNEISTPILENNLGHAAYHDRKYDEATTHYQKAISIMMTSELAYLLEISCVYNNLGAVEYDKENYHIAKDYFEKAIFTLQRLKSQHIWMTDYKQNLKCTEEKINKRPRVE